MFLPPNVTPLIQPMDQNAIRLTKLFYKNSLLSEIVATNVKEVSQFLKQHTLCSACFLLSSAWEKITSEVLKKCWKKILTWELDDPEDDIPLAVLQNIPEVASLKQTFALLQEICPNQAVCTIEEIEKWNYDEVDDNNTESTGTDSEDDDCVLITEPSVKRCKHDEAIRNFQFGIDWAIENNIEFRKVQVLSQLREEALNLKLSSSKQTTITTFFK